ncbi:MAG: RidA family protein [Sandaracinaceae bacterium]
MPIIVNPDGLAPPRGYSNGMVLRGDSTLFVAGQIGWDRDCAIVSDDFAAQFAKALDNVLEVVTEAGGDATRIGRLTIYVTDKAVYMAAAKDVGRAYRERMGEHYPAMSLVEVADLLEPRAQVEIEATAILGGSE